MKKFSLFVLVILVAAGCNKNTPANEIKGMVYEGSSTGPHTAGTVEFQTKRVIDGVLQDYFTTTASMPILVDGSYGVTFELSNLLAARLVAHDTNYITDTININPDRLRNEHPFIQDIHLYPEASVRVHLTRTGTFANVNFNWSNANFQCDCCTNTVRNFPGLTDAEFTCPVYGNYWLKYFVLVNATNGTTTITDSIYCQPFQENLLELNL